MGRINLVEALELTILIAQKDPRRHPRVAVRWLQRYLDEREVAIGDVALVVSALTALTGDHPAEAVRVLRALAGSF